MKTAPSPIDLLISTITSMMAPLIIGTILLIGLTFLIRKTNGGITPRSWNVEKVRLLSARELQFMALLEDALGAAPVHICPQCSIDEFIKFTGPDAFATRAIYRARRSDFTLIDSKASVLLAIEVDDASHDKMADKDAARDAVLKQAGIPTLRIPKGRLPDLYSLKRSLRDARIPGIRP